MGAWAACGSMLKNLEDSFKNLPVGDTKMKYQLYTYEIWGNSRDGYQVNDVYRQSVIIEVDETTSDRAINRRLSAQGVVWDGEFGYTLYGSAKRDGRPVCELRAIEGDSMIRNTIEYDDLIITYCGELDDTGRADIFDISVEGEHGYSERELKRIIWTELNVDDWGYLPNQKYNEV